MNELIPSSLPKVQDLYSDIESAANSDLLQVILNQPPKNDWVKTHPFISGWKYLPIDKVEFLLKKIFKEYSIEILREGTAFNGVYVVVRVHYLHPIENKMKFHDGLGGCQLQTQKGESPANLAAINNGALSMAFPIAETLAIKDACDKFGRVFGSDLNRKDVITFGIDDKLQNAVKSKQFERAKKHIENSKSIDQLEKVEAAIYGDDELTELYNNKKYELKSK